LLLIKKLLEPKQEESSRVDPLSWTPSLLGERSLRFRDAHHQYPAEFRQQMVALGSGGSYARGAVPTSLSRRARRSATGQADRVTSEKRLELKRLRRTTMLARMEREILARAAAWFAPESGSVLSESSSL